MFKYLAALAAITVALILPAAGEALPAPWICIQGCEPAPDPAPPVHHCYLGWCQ
jgi:hypothetical protein